MERTLRSFLQQADDLHEQLEKYCVAMSADQIESKANELQNCIKMLQSISYQIANVSNIAMRVVHRKRKAKKSTIADVVKNSVNPYPSDASIGLLRSLNPIETKEPTKGVQIPVHVVPSVKEIPVSHLYYVEDIKQYAFNVEGIVVRGDLCNIVDYQTEKSAECEYGVDCKSFQSGNPCPYYHDPEDYIHHKLPVPDTNIRNFTIGSWIYSKKKSPKTYFTRHIGSKDRLIYDLNTLKRVQYREEISNREGQLMHDLLIYMILNSRGLLNRYEKNK